MQGPLIGGRQGKDGKGSEAGFVLVAAMVVLLALSLFGIWAIRTSTFELDIAGSTQRSEKQFNVAEGGAVLEAGRLGFQTRDWYVNPDPGVDPNTTYYAPQTEPDFDPGNDTAAVPGGEDPTDSTTWPRENLVQGILNIDNEVDYRYLVTYMGYDPVIGSGTGFSGYKYRIQGQGVEGGVGSAIVEVGGTKLGPEAVF